MDRVMSSYLAWWLNHPQSQAKLIRDVARGTYIPFISKGELDAFLVALPALAVQARESIASARSGLPPARNTSP